MVQFRGQNISEEDVKKALRRFDEKYPNPNDFRDWLDKDKYKYVLEYNGKKYPPKRILSDVTGIDVSEFTGGRETNSVFEKLDFKISQKTGFWKIAPGENARFWSRCIKDKNIAVGWDELDDLSGVIGNYDEYEKVYNEKYKKKQRSKFQSQMEQLWQFINLRKGDMVVANKGMQSIVGVGEVTAGYELRADYTEYKHTISVDWYDTKERSISKNTRDIVKDWWSLTLKELSESEFVKLTRNNIQTLEKSFSSTLDVQLLQRKKQIILYGPPGTGKTYNTKLMAVSFISGVSLEHDLIEYDELPDEEPNKGKKEIANPLFNKIELFVKTLSGIKAKDHSSMRGYYSDSKAHNKTIGIILPKNWAHN